MAEHDVLLAGRIIQQPEPTECGVWLLDKGYSLRICNVPAGKFKLWDTVECRLSADKKCIESIEIASAVTKLAYLHVRP